MAKRARRKGKKSSRNRKNSNFPFKMHKNCISATLWAAILWSLIFVEISVVMFTPSLYGLYFVQKLIHLSLLPFMALICVYMFFRSIKEKPTLLYGFYIGLYFLALGTVLDLIITIPLFMFPQGRGIADFYNQWNLWLGFAEVLYVCSLAGWFMEKKRF